MLAEDVVTDDMETELKIVGDYAEETADVKQYTISGYGADFDVEGLVRRLNRGDIEIPEFQRTFVWNQTRASRFVESLLMGLPVPGIFLYRDKGSQTLRVIDGQQRLLSLQSYYGGQFPGLNREFRLAGVSEAFDGKAYADLSAQDKRRLNDSIIHASIIQQEDPEDDGSSQFALFERLNTNSTPLSPQEIRAAIYGGKLNNLLVELSDCEEWRALVGKPNLRKRDQELILRFLALYHEWSTYKRPMKEFLNNFMKDNRDLKTHAATFNRKLFHSTVKTVLDKLGRSAFRLERAVNAALMDALMVGIARRLDSGAIAADIQPEYDSLLANEEFRASIYAGTSQSDNVRTRLRLATEAFASVE